MKTLGLVGGMSWESSREYYRLINEEVRIRMGGFHSCRSLLYSVDFAEIEKWQHEGNKPALERAMIKAVRQLEAGGADLIILCTNTMHEFYESMTKNTRLPMLHIAEAAGQTMTEREVQKPLVLGTKFTMEGSFYKGYLQSQFGFISMVPGIADRQIVHDIIYRELVHGIIQENSRETLQHIIRHASDKGADCVLLACTELPLLIGDRDVSVPVIDTTEVHARKAVQLLLEEKEL